MKICIVGALGQLGRDCEDVFLSRGREVTGVDLPELNITSLDSVERVLAPLEPDVVVNCAAYTHVDDCEAEEEQALAVNAAGPENLATFLRARGGRLVHVSTDYVFDGSKPAPAAYTERDPVGPASAYGRTKLEGERRVIESGVPHVIARTAWLYGVHGGNFLKAILRKALSDDGTPLRVVDDQRGTPTWSFRLAHQIDRLVEAGAEGLFHTTGLGACSWYDFACAFLALMGIDRTVEPCKTEAYPRPARRPPNSALTSTRLEAEGLNVMVDWRQDLEDFVMTHGDSLREECTSDVEE